jgi:hypothetical protein
MRYLLIITFLFFTGLACAQTPMPPQEDISPVQAGTATLDNGKTTISLNKLALRMLSDKNNAPEYVVSVTPLCNCGQFYVSTKDSASFTVQSEGVNSGIVSFDYVVYVKRTITLPLRPFTTRAPGAK